MNEQSDFNGYAKAYIYKLRSCFTENIYIEIEKLSSTLIQAWRKGTKIYICGNGGSSANAQHIANDLIYGIGMTSLNSKDNCPGINIEALTSNSNIITCLANDIGYENIFSYQLEVKGKENEILIVLSGSGNSPNIVNALKKANEKKMHTYALLGFDGGICKTIAQNSIHIPLKDMEVAEDSQMIIFNICKKWLIDNKPKS